VLLRFGLSGNVNGGWQSSFSNDSVSADAIVWREPQPGNKMVFVLLFDHVPTRFAENGSRGHDVNAIDLG
jgi:hypothetical protein